MADFSQYAASPTSLGRKGAMVAFASGSAAIGAAVKAVVLCAAGNVVYTPKDDPARTITMTDLPAGYVLPHVPGTITEAGTTAPLCTVEG